jgi:hypothetical protein
MADLERFSVLNAIGIHRLLPADSARAADYVDLLVRTEYAGGSWAALDSATRANRGQPWSFRVPAADDAFWSFSRANSAYDPRIYWERVRVPVLLVFGERDERTPVDASRRNIEAALGRAENRHVTERTFPGADHSLRLASGQPGSPWPRTAPGYPEVVLDWIQKTAMAR